MKKKVFFLILFIFLISATFPFVSAAINATQEKIQVDKAYSCLQGKVNTTALCSSLSTEEKIFSLLSVNRCQTELIADSSNNGECWPSGNCRIKTTAQAALALKHAGADSSKAQSWLLNQTKGTTDLTWFLEIESPDPTSCTIGYAGQSFNVNIGEDKKITNNAGSCLSLSEGDYWLRIAPSCFEEEFEVSCDKQFLTTLLFQKPSSSTIHVSPTSSSASPEGTTTEKVESFCFVQDNICNYEGTLWTSLVLDSFGKDVSSYIPYIMTFADDNKALLPSMFLYSISSDLEQKTTLLSKQKSKKWWSESGDKFYDTALALYPFQKETLTEKTNSKDYLLSVQDANGCWENNVRNTAFILTSIWPRSFSSSGGSGGGGTNKGKDTFSCEDSGYFCTSSSSCDGEIVSGYDCPALYRCCSVKPKQSTCADQGGEICSSSQICSGGTELSASDVVGQNCCIGGTCQTSGTETLSECEQSGGVCRSSSCNANEEASTFYSCEFSGDSCCIQKTPQKKSLLWVWILLILIVLVTIAIIFRNKLRMLWLRISKGGSRTSPHPGPGHPFPPSSPPIFPRRPFPERRILLPQHHTQPPAQSQQRPIPKPKSAGASKELDDVLKKLKDMAK